MDIKSPLAAASVGSQAEGKRNTLSAGRIQGLIHRIMKYTQFRVRMSDDVLTHRRRMIHTYIYIFTLNQSDPV